MKGQRSDRLRLLDMRDWTDKILLDFAKLGTELPTVDDLRYDGFVRRLSIVGEAAYKLSRELRAAHPEVAWRAIMATRHILVHEYYQVNENRIWDIIIRHLPVLRQQLQTIIASLPE